MYVYTWAHVYCTMFSTYGHMDIVGGVQYILGSVQYTVHICPMYNVHYTWAFVYCTMYSTHGHMGICMYSVHYSVHYPL